MGVTHEYFRHCGRRDAPARFEATVSNLFATDAGKQRVKQAIVAVEGQTRAELVVAVRARVAHYRHIDFLVGFALSLVALLLFLFYPVDFEIAAMPIDSIVAFAFGTVLSAHCPPLRRLLVSRRLVDTEVGRAARAAFVDLGITRTAGRSGILVFVAMYERRVEVVTDVGIDPPLLGAAWTRGLTDLRRAVAKTDLDAFVIALTQLGPTLARVMPRAEDDRNELPDEVV
jgi:putative membrane protein